MRREKFFFNKEIEIMKPPVLIFCTNNFLFPKKKKRGEGTKNFWKREGRWIGGFDRRVEQGQRGSWNVLFHYPGLSPLTFFFFYIFSPFFAE